MLKVMKELYKNNLENIIKISKQGSVKDLDTKFNGRKGMYNDSKRWFWLHRSCSLYTGGEVLGGEDHYYVEEAMLCLKEKIRMLETQFF